MVTAAAGAMGFVGKVKITAGIQISRISKQHTAHLNTHVSWDADEDEVVGNDERLETHWRTVLHETRDHDNKHQIQDDSSHHRLGRPQPVAVGRTRIYRHRQQVSKNF